jgi:hypothetical protein
MWPQTCPQCGEENQGLGILRGERLFLQYPLPQKSEMCYHSFLYGTGGRLSFA